MTTTKSEKRSNAQLVIELNGKREYLLGQLRRFRDFIDAYDNSKLELLKLKLERAENWFDKYGIAYMGLKPLVSGDNLEILEEEFTCFENDHDELLCMARSLVPVQRATSTPVSDILVQNAGKGSSLNSSHIEAHIKLPSLGLPQFSGAYEDWTEFSDTFNGSVASNVSLSAAQKLQYLKYALRGDAANVVQSLKICDANYEVAMTLLRNRYEMKNLIVRSHLKAIAELPKLQRESATQLRLINDTVTKSIRCIESLEISITNWDTLLIFMIGDKLDNVTNREWQSSIKPNILPSWTQFREFLNKRCEFLEMLSNPATSTTINDSNSRKKPKAINLTATAKNCVLCECEHAVQSCTTWSTLDVIERKELIKRHKLCFRCLSAWNYKHRCRRDACSKCKGSHHAVIHEDKEQRIKPDVDNAERSVVTTAIKANQQTVLLSTAIVYLHNENGKRIKCRALLDNGAQSNFLRENICRELNLMQCPINSVVCGINSKETPIHSKVSVVMSSTSGEFIKEISCLVIDRISDDIPSRSFATREWNIPRNIRLADPTFSVSDGVDVLLGAEIFWAVLGERKIDFEFATLRHTQLGWILAGAVIPDTRAKVKTLANLALQDQLSKFWQLEQCMESDRMSNEQRACEKHFKENTFRNNSGRFVVKIPLKEELTLLGDSYQHAKGRLLRLEKRFRTNEDFKDSYSEFMSEYINLGHMQKVDLTIGNKFRYFMPHHGVLKTTSTSTKLRTVFDASAKTSSGYSYNDLQLVGPIVQNDLFAIILNFRRPKYVMTADIEKMYRQVLIHPEQRHLQSILWRSRESDTMHAYELNTVTYGTTAAPYLATGCLEQIAMDVKQAEPNVARAIQHCMYVDDFLGGADTIKESNRLALRLRSLLQEYGFPLRKWLANDIGVLEGIPMHDRTTNFISLGEKNETRTLGLIWAYQSDDLMYKIESTEGLRVVTKRQLLACIAKIYDPLGLLAPCVIVAKMLLQGLWQEKIQWDDPLPKGLRDKWLDFASHTSALNSLKVPRHVVVDQPTVIDIHGFADASQLAFGACVYFKSENILGLCKVRLVCAKSRVAPLRSETIPRLELCAAALLSRLVSKILRSADLRVRRCVLWSDSTIALAWIRSEPYLLKSFVANRVSQIQNLNVTNDWRHVGSEDNPADLVSRGIGPERLQNTKLWWNGPSWLIQSEETWPKQSTITSSELPEIRSSRILGNLCNTPELNCFFRISNFRRMLRAGAVALGWLERSKGKSAKYEPMTSEKLDTVLRRLIRVEQEKYFRAEFKDLRTKPFVNKTSRLFKLRPFIDSEGILRVGGRLQKTDLTYDAKHQLIIPSESDLSRRIAESQHLDLMHCGAQQLLFSLRQRYWIIRGRVLVKGVINKCVTCFKAKPHSIIPVFGPLPAERVTPLPPFWNTGADYAGPFQIRDKRSRGYKILKAYVCIFVCLSTKAVHLDLVSNLSSEEFIACLRRFIARRGKPNSIMTDNGTNFVGGNNELEGISQFLNKNASTIHNTLIGEGIQWKFIPPRSPNFGGIWEAGVKSVKYHLKRVAGQALLIFSEFYTLLAQIEAILNSRPLSPLSSDPDDLNPLTPGHFLIGRPLTSLIDEPLKDVTMNRLSRYQMIQQLTQHYWTRWSKEYLNELQHVRGVEPRVIKVNSLVIVKEDNLPPCRWRMARVLELFPGADGVVRVVKIKTSTGEYKRAVRNLCVCP